MTSSERGVDPKAVAMYLATLAGVAGLSWVASRLGRPRPHPRMDDVSDE